MTEYRVGSVVKGKVTGIQRYGAFVELDSKTQGLVHISEITDGYVRDIHDFLSVGDIVTVRILTVEEESRKISLTLRGVHKVADWKKRTVMRVPKQTATGFATLQQKLAEWIEEAKVTGRH